ncbi:MAG: hypothetical protein LC714_04950 [Actinobacteria bacterium]|nr:hypothetical protein [Actinomycetota bacterium]
MIKLFYDSGTLVATGASRSDLPDSFVWDGRTRQWRAPASAYRGAILRLRESETPHEDLASAFERPPLESRVALAPRPYQKEALAAWRREGLRGVVVLPTGAGRSRRSPSRPTTRPTSTPSATATASRSWSTTRFTTCPPRRTPSSPGCSSPPTL